MAGDVAQQSSSSSVAKYVPSLAPVLLVAIGYMDPGNWASAIEGGSRFGFELLWVVIISNVMAALFQTLATRLGLVSGKHLAEICREDYPRPVCLLLWLLSELSIISLDLTMVAGTAIGLNLLLGVPILPSVLVLAFDGLLVMLALPIVGVRRAELVAASVVGFVLVCFALGTLISPPSPAAMLSGLWPKVRGDSLYTAVGLIGANVVPHTFYLHSALLQRQHTLAGQSKDIVVQENMRDTIAAFGIALVANVVVLIVAASTFHNVGLVILTLQDAHALMEQILSSSIAPMVFGLALLCAGQLSSLTGTMTGKVTMEGFLEMTMEPWLHRTLVRGVAVLPAAFVAWHHGSEGLYRLLLFSQIIIAVELPFSAVPLIKASASEARMGSYRISSLVESVAWIAVALVVVANIWLVFDLLLQEIDEFAGFAAHLENLLGTDSFGHYGEDTVNTSVFALVLVGIGLCVGFLVWLVVTPLRVDRIAMERKWVLEYELFERNERGNQEQLEQLEASELGTKSFDMIPMTEDIMLPTNLVGLEFPHPELVERVEPVPWSSSASTSSDDVEEVTSEVLELPNGVAPPELDDKPEPEPLEDVVLVDDIAEPAELVVVTEPPPEEVIIPEVEKPSEEEGTVVDEEVKKVEIASPEIDRGGHVLTEPEIAGTIATFLKDASFSAKEVDPEPVKPVRHVSLAADDVESMALKKAEAEADADMMDKDEDDVDELEREDVLVGPLSHGNIGHSYGNIAYDGPSSTRSVGGRSDVSECNGGGSGSGSLSRLSGLGRAARRQFAAHLDEFWGKLFDLHGQSISSKTSSGLARTSSAAAAAASYEPPGRSGEYQSSRLNSAAQEYLDYGAKRGVSKSTSSLQQQVIHMEAYARAHSNSNASTSAGFPGYSDSYNMGRAESLSTSPYLAERQYSSLRLPSYSEEFERQPATIHGYFAPSFLGRSAASSPTHKSPRPMDMSSSSSIRALSGQAHAQQPLGIGVERDFESSQYGYQGSFEDTIRNLRSSQLSMNNRNSHDVSYKLNRGIHDRDMDGPRSLDSRMFERTTLDPLVYRATGELHMPSSGHSPIGRLGSVSGDRAPLSFDEISPLSRRDGFSIQSQNSEQNSLWSRPFEQLFGGGVTDNNSSSRLRGTGNMVPPTRSSSGSIPNTRSPLKVSDSYNNNSAYTSSTGTDADLETMENLRACIGKLLCLEGSEWLFRIDNGSDEDLIAAISAVEKMHMEGDAPDRVSRWQTHGRSVSSLSKVTNNNESRSRVCYCSDSCIWGKGLIVSFGVWCVHRVLELSLMESRPELWGKYTYVLNRLQGVLEPAFSKPRTVPAMCSCVLEAAGSDILSKQRGLGGGGRGSSGLMKQRSNSFLNGGGGEMMHINTTPNQVVTTYPYPWPWGRNTSSTKGRGASAAVFLEMIKEVEQAVGSRKGRTGTAAGDVAFPKGKENLASVLKRYKRRLGNKPPGAAVTTAATAATSGGGRRNSSSNLNNNNNNNNNVVNGYSPALLFAACL